MSPTNFGPYKTRRGNDWMEILVNDELGDTLAKSALFNVINHGWVGGEPFYQRECRKAYRYTYMYVRTVLDSAEEFAWNKLAEQEIKMIAWSSSLIQSELQAKRPLPHEKSCDCSTCYW